MNRRWSILSALLATALLLCCMPGLLRQQLASEGRTDDRLKPAASRTMVVWVTSWLEEDRQLLSSLCADFEKQRPGLRIYLRRVDAAELTAPDAVLPDVVLHTTGDVLAPGEALLPMVSPEGVAEGLLATGMSQGQLFGIPLWYRPMLFSVPKEWFEEADGTQPEQAPKAGQAYFTLATPVPEQAATVVTLADVPWRRLMEASEVVSECGAGLPLLLLHCPSTLREEMAGLEPTLRKPQGDEAGVCSLSTHLAREQEAVGLLLPPPTGQRARYLSLCREGEDAQAFVHFLLGLDAQAAAANAHLMPVVNASVPEPSWAAKIVSGGDPFLPNAFLMDSSSMDQLCIQDFCRREDPVATLLKLR